MADQPSPNPIDPQRLGAFADGEFDAAERARLAELIAKDPRSVAGLLAAHQLREATRRSLLTSTPPAPLELRKRIEQMVSGTASGAAKDETQTRSEIHDPASLRSRLRVSAGRRAGSASFLRLSSFWNQRLLVAASLLLAVALVFAFTDTFGRIKSVAVANASVLPVSTVHDLTRKHLRCFDHPEMLHPPAGFPTKEAELAPAVAQLLGQSFCPPLDFGSIGYRFVGAGICNAPGARSVHLLYHPVDPASRLGPLSLWIEADRRHLDRLGLPSGRTFAAADEVTAEPVLFWRSGEMAFFLVSDTSRGVGEAARLLTRRCGSGKKH